MELNAENLYMVSTYIDKKIESMYFYSTLEEAKKKMNESLYLLLKESNYANTGLIDPNDSLSNMLKTIKKSWLTRYDCRISEISYLFFDNKCSSSYKGEIMHLHYDSKSESYKITTL